MDYKAEVHKAGRITIPVEIRKQFNIAEGDVLTIRQENDELKIITPKQALELARSLVKPYFDTSEASVDDFIEWRRDEAHQEEQALSSGEPA